MPAFKIDIGTAVSGVDLSDLTLWDAAAMAQICGWSVERIVERTTAEGVGADGADFARYSTKRIWIGLKSETALRLTPKGGVPSRTGRSVRYDHGWQQYKDESRLGQIQSAEVDLTLSGQMMREVDTLEATATEGLVGLRGQSRTYAVHVNAKRPFMGHHEGELVEMDAEIASIVDDRMQRAAAQGGPSGSPSTEPVL